MKKAVYIAGSVVVVIALIYYVAFPALYRANYKRVYEIGCSLNMREILKEALVTRPDDQLPSDLLSMSNRLDTPKFLFCPSDRIHRPAANWAEFTPDNSSYVVAAPNIRKADTNAAFLRCTIHGFVGYADGRLLDSFGRLIKPRH